MNKVFVCLSCLLMLFVFGGCGAGHEEISSLSGNQKELQEHVFPDFLGDPAKNEFSEFLSGVWEIKEGKYKDIWGFEFVSDGSIVKMIHGMAGRVDLAEGGVYGGAKTDDSYYLFVMGPCGATYTSATRMLKVKIIVEHYTLKFPVDELQGRVENYLEGPVSQDSKTWNANLLNYVWLDGANPPPKETIEAHPIELVFSKTR